MHALEERCAILEGIVDELQKQLAECKDAAAMVQLELNQLKEQERLTLPAFKSHKDSKQYSTVIRECYYGMLTKHVPAKHASDVLAYICSVLLGLDEKKLLKELPTPKTGKHFMKEMDVLAKLQIGTHTNIRVSILVCEYWCVIR